MIFNIFSSEATFILGYVCKSGVHLGYYKNFHLYRQTDRLTNKHNPTLLYGYAVSLFLLRFLEKGIILVLLKIIKCSFFHSMSSFCCVCKSATQQNVFFKYFFLQFLQILFNLLCCYVFSLFLYQTCSTK